MKLCPYCKKELSLNKSTIFPYRCDYCDDDYAEYELEGDENDK